MALAVEGSQQEAGWEADDGGYTVVPVWRSLVGVRTGFLVKNQYERGRRDGFRRRECKCKSPERLLLLQPCF